MSTEAAWSLTPSVDSSLGLRLLPGLLSVTAGSVDVISFLGLGGLFTAHITGNLVILAAHIVTGGTAPIAPMLSVPVFMLVLGAARLLAGGLERVGLASLRPLLLAQFVFLLGFLILTTDSAPSDPDETGTIVAGMLGVAAMAVQNTLVQISLKGAPSTAVMTTNITRFMMDIGEIVIGTDPDNAIIARARARHTWPAIVGFAVGCSVGAWCEVSFGLWSLLLPTGLALMALALGFSVPHPLECAR